jgi:hypothetical protein
MQARTPRKTPYFIETLSHVSLYIASHPLRHVIIHIISEMWAICIRADRLDLPKQPTAF